MTKLTKVLKRKIVTVHGHEIMVELDPRGTLTLRAARCRTSYPFDIEDLFQRAEYADASRKAEEVVRARRSRRSR